MADNQVWCVQLCVYMGNFFDLLIITTTIGFTKYAGWATQKDPKANKKHLVAPNLISTVV